MRNAMGYIYPVQVLQDVSHYHPPVGLRIGCKATSRQTGKMPGFADWLAYEARQCRHSLSSGLAWEDAANTDAYHTRLRAP